MTPIEAIKQIMAISTNSTQCCGGLSEDHVAEIQGICRKAMESSPADKQPPLIPAGYKLVPCEPTAEMIEAAGDAYMPFGDMDIALRMAILAAPDVQQPLKSSLALDAATHLTNWLDMDWCDCEGGHICGYNEVKRTRDALLAAAEQQPSQHRERGTNRYGLDMAYFRNVIERDLDRPLDNYRPDEFARVLVRMAITADDVATVKEITQRHIAAIPMHIGAPRVTNKMKAEHCGEYMFTVPDADEDGFEIEREVTVPWSVAKDIYKGMASTAIAEYSAAAVKESLIDEPSPTVITSAADLVEGEYYWVQEVDGTGYMEVCVVRGDALWHTGSNKRLLLDIFNGRYIAEPIAAPKFAGVAHG